MKNPDRHYENTHIFISDNVDGPLDIPVIEPEEYEGCEWISFNYAKSERHPESKGVHFYLDDYQFARLWKDPMRYIDMLRRFKYVMSPDFSMFTDYPKVLQMYSHYKKHWIAQLWQEYGIMVIPTICWSDQSSFEWCFDGEPEGSVVSVASTGCANAQSKIDAFNVGYEAMITKLQPTKVIFFGKDILNENANRSIVEFHKTQAKERMNGLDEKSSS